MRDAALETGFLRCQARRAGSRWCWRTPRASWRSGTARPRAASSRSSPTRSRAPRPPRRSRRRQAALRQRRGRPALRLRHGGHGAAASTPPVGEAQACLKRPPTGSATLRERGYRLTPQRELILGAVDELGHATPDEVLAHVREQRVGGEHLHRLPHPRGARGARPGPARPPQRPRPDVPLRRRARALPPRLPELSAGRSRLTWTWPPRSCPGSRRTTVSCSTSATSPSSAGVRSVTRMTSPLLDLPGAVGRRRHRRAGRGPLRLVLRRAAHPRRRRGLRRPLPPRRAPDQRPRPADLAALAHHPVLRGPGPDSLDRGADPEPAGPRRARLRGLRRRRGVHRAHRARRRRRAGGLPGPDAVHDAGRGHRRDRGARGDLAPLGPRGLRRLRAVPRDQLTTYAHAAGPACGLWAFEALRIARGEPRFGIDTDHRTIPNEVGWIGPAVHLDKGCYRGQETVARVHTLGRPPRRLVLLHLDGSENLLPDGRQRR